ncbi:MAG: chromosome segregation protein SMC, partial [Candidatus Aenigmarchaeota archaeon]|nr:chromosome segregation protein SMC [Candidatus Aenigmarchaeota archaeon]
IPIPTGFSVFTGPNGSGKSNIGEAIQFVLGKVPSKNLRAPKAENLIFTKGKGKDASDYAFVTLHFDNRKRLLPLGEDEVSVTRKLNKKGVSTYKVNGKVVTRGHMLDIFSRVGLHPDAHNIIQQGDVNQIVEMGPYERRKIIDEVAGIAEYDEKKHKAELELAKIEGRVKEAEIVMREKVQVVERLRQERDAALQYKGLADSLEGARTALVWKDFDSAEKGIESVSNKIAAKEGEAAKLQEEIDKLDKELQKQEKNLENLAQDVFRSTDEIEVEKKITRLNGEIERLRDKIEFNKREMLRLDALTERARGFGDTSQAVKAILGFKGVQGTVGELIRVENRYATAIEVSAGRHLQDVIVDSMETAVGCVQHLKRNKIGRAVFIPLDKVEYPAKRPLPKGAIGWLSELVKYDPKFGPAVSYLFGKTACAENIDVAKGIAARERVRLVTLDGDIIEPSGVVTGGFYQKRNVAKEVDQFKDERNNIVQENIALASRMAEIEAELSVLAKKERKRRSFNLDIEKSKIDTALTSARGKRRQAYEQRLTIQQEIGKFNIDKARFEAKLESLNLQKDEKAKEAVKPFLELGVTELREREREFMRQMQVLGNINMKALDDFETIKTEFEDFKEKLDRIVAERNSILEAMQKIEEKRMAAFMHTLNSVQKHFKDVYRELTGGEASLSLDDPDGMDAGLQIQASPGGKQLLHMDAMSGGEKTLTAFAFVFAIQKHKPLPFYILDEADAALDKKNSKRVGDMLSKHSKDTQFIVISHNDEVIRVADQVYGVSMQEGESKIFGVKLPVGTN